MLSKVYTDGKVHGLITKISKSTEGNVYRIITIKSIDNKLAFNKATASEAAVIKACLAGKIVLDNASVDPETHKIHSNFNSGSLERFIESYKFGINPVVIISELRIKDTNRLIGYRIASDDKVLNIRLNDILSRCRAVKERADGKQSVVAIQNAVYVPESQNTKEHIRGFSENQFIVEYIENHSAKNVKPAVVNKNENNKQISKLQSLFTDDQIMELKLGKQHGVNIRVYGNNRLSAEQMRQIRIALEDGLNPTQFASPEYKPEIMNAYRIQMKYGVNIDAFIRPDYSIEQIMILSAAYLSGVDVSRLANPKKTPLGMDRERIELENKLWREFDYKEIKI
ncbi:MAG: hypothetical protein IJ593_00675 [Lachnospiraceae bacterium]|nr:hypothetical protein [Lachnospiraceae bacterium]